MKIKNLFMAMVIFAGLLSCKSKKQGTEVSNTSPNSENSNITTNALNSVDNYDGFEGTSIASWWHKSPTMPAHTELSTSHRYGTTGKSFKSYWQSSYYTGTNASKHSEIEGIYPATNREGWYGWTVYFPSKSDAGADVNITDSQPMIFTQFHDWGTLDQPPIAFNLINGRMSMDYKWGDTNSYGVYPNKVNKDLGTMPYNTWVKYVVHVRWSSTPTATDGLLQLYKNGVSQINITNVPMGSGKSSLGWPYFKIGIYHHSGKANGLKIVHYDEVSHGFNSSYAQVAP